MNQKVISILIFLSSFNFLSTSHAQSNFLSDILKGSIVCQQYNNKNQSLGILKIDGLKNGFPKDQNGDWIVASKDLELSVYAKDKWKKLSNQDFTVSLSFPKNEDRLIFLDFSISQKVDAQVTALDKTTHKNFRVAIWHAGIDLRAGDSFKAEIDECAGTIGGDVGDYFSL